ncbi:DUF4859 domain-containing protein [Zunongwangia sp. SCSIO 43204]|uniref:DUF4859 domain-containing protein n=1 Tax=Zunongwangia sp. SCSIO 43204 TaxID=2779359 RepID=UPI001CA7C62B|nr:DUF4859 domain-containing protein [Zunongwangia sp. SCSIO 43204]UAB82781.1 DUF4859 domain-containing protein [Zunongwangia sp. SCSIO 43204]
MRLLKKLIILLLLNLFFVNCSSDESFEEPVGGEEEETPVEEPEEEPAPEEGELSIYIPNEFSEMDFEDPESTWTYNRSRESEHFIVFWGVGYGDNAPGSTDTPAQYRVDIDDLLERAEDFYALNIGELGFAETGVGNSNLDEYKMMIFLFYQEEWLATGSGYDDTIGALWISPNTAQPVGHTIAHEIGHSFQYQVFSDIANGHGFRYGFGGNGGNAFWEQTAQWQGFQSYPELAFTVGDFGVYIENYNKHIHHEDYRYASYFIHYYWTSLHGRDFIGRLWREAQEPEDPIQAYMRITGISVDDLNAEIYDAATKFVTWDLDDLRSYGEDFIGAQNYNYTSQPDGSHIVSPDYAPQTTGYNVIPLNVPEANSEVSVDFTGIPNAAGFNTVDASIAGWRYGFVALQENGTRVYGEMNDESDGSASLVVPENTTNLWFVVTGAPSEYSPHAWDDDNSNDDQWPYQVSFAETNILGIVDLPEDGEPQNVDLSYDISFPADTENYTGTNVTLNTEALAEAFLMQPNQIAQEIGNSIQFYAVNSNGDLIAETTANGYGHWFDAAGDVIGWGDNAVVYSEFTESNFNFEIGQYPGHSVSGDTYTISQALVYEYETGEFAQATITFNITIE